MSYVLCRLAARMLYSPQSHHRFDTHTLRSTARHILAQHDEDKREREKQSYVSHDVSFLRFFSSFCWRNLSTCLALGRRLAPSASS